MPYDYYEPKLVDEPINVALNAAIERAAAGKAELPHPYLGASIVGSDCLRRVQYDWWCRPEISARTRAIFARGHYFEARVREQLVAAGLTFAPPQVLAFTAVNPFDAERAQLWSDRAANIIAATRAGELLPRAYKDPDKFPCKICPHVARCWR